MIRDNDHDAIIELQTLIADLFKSHRIQHDQEQSARDAAYVELQRRLGDLNHAHEIARDKEASFLSVPVFTAFQAALAATTQRMAEDINRIGSTSLTRERFDEAQKEQTTRERLAAEAVTAITAGTRGERSGSQRTTQMVTWAVGAGLTVVFIVTSLFIGLRSKPATVVQVPAAAVTTVAK